MNKKDHKGSKDPKHISEVLKEAKKQWLRDRTEHYMNSPEFKDSMDQCKFVQVVFLYIDGDPNYIRTIFLN